MKRIGHILFLMLAFGVGLSPSPACAKVVLEKVIIVSRHGIRPPTDEAKINRLSVEDWPSWPVPEGELTPHGAAAATLMGQYDRARFAKAGLVAPNGCPDAGDVFAWSDKAQRTRATANALLQGLFPGCDLKAGFDAKGAGRLFHPMTAGIAHPDKGAAQKAILSALGGDLAAVRKRYAGAFADLAHVLNGPRPKMCRKAGLITPCALIDLPWQIKDADKGNVVTLKGPLDLAATVAEVFRLEYAEGLPLDQVGWGRIKDADRIKDLLELHKALYDVTLRVPLLARGAASQMLHQVALALRLDEDGSGENGPPGNKLVLFVGHDTTIAPMQAALGVTWTLPGYPENDTPPDGALLFERLRDSQTEDRYVRLSYIAQSLDQLRMLAPLADRTDGSGPEITVLTLPGCPAGPEPGLCRLQDFLTIVQSRSDPSAIAPISYPRN